MAQYFSIHPSNPQPRLVRQSAEIVRAGGVIAYPTDSSYAFGCQIGNADAVQRAIRLYTLTNNSTKLAEYRALEHR